MPTPGLPHTAELPHTALSHMVRLRSKQTPCLCQALANVAGEYQSGAMVGCDGPCGGWYHPQCIGYTEKDANKVLLSTLPFCCYECKEMVETSI